MQLVIMKFANLKIKTSYKEKEVLEAPEYLQT